MGFLTSSGSFCRFLKIFCIDSCIIGKKDQFMFSRSVYFLFLFLDLLYWLELLLLCKIGVVRVDILALFPVVGLSQLSLMLSVGFFVDVLQQDGAVLIYSCLSEFLVTSGCWFF